MVCPFCSEEHPVTVDRCPLTGQPLRLPEPVEALAAPPERAPFPALLAEAARLYRRNLLVFLVTGSVAFVPLAGLQIWSSIRSAPPAGMAEATRLSRKASQEQRNLSAEEQAQLHRAMAAMRPDRKNFLITMALTLMLLPLILAAQMLSHAALVPLVGDRALGGNMGPGRAWLAVGLQPGAILWTATLATLATMIGAVFCLLPGLLAALGFALSMPIVLLERRSGTDALRRSWKLMAVEWPRVLGMWLIAFGAMALVMVPISLWFVRVAVSDPDAMSALASSWRAIVVQVAQLAICLLTLPLPVIGTTLVYLHARSEQENVPLAQLQLQMQRAATGT